MVTRWLTLPALLLLLILGAGAHAEVAVPPLRSPVTDLTGTLTAEQSATLEQQLRAFETRKGSQIAVLIVPTTQPETIQQYSFRVAEEWKLGRRGVNDGALLAIAKDDRAVWIQVGYGLEGALPDVLANRIAVARKRYIDAVQAYNITVRSFPSNLTAKMFGHTPKQNFTVQDEATISKPPTVDFNTPAQPEPKPENPG